MSPTLAKKLRFSDAVYAIDTTPKTLRNWLQRGLVEIHTPQPESGWTEYSFIDIAILALVRSLVGFGVSVVVANQFAHAVLNMFPEYLRIEDQDEVSAGILAMPWTNRRIYVFRKGDDWEVRLASLWESGLDPSQNKFLDPSLPSGVAALRSELEPAPVFLSMDVETVLRTAFERAAESMTEGTEAE